MRISFYVRVVFVSLMLGTLIAACHDAESRTPSSPSSPAIVSVDISGPASVAPGDSAQLVANAHLSDGSVKIVGSGTGVLWHVDPGVVQISQAGIVTAGQTPGERLVTLDVTLAGVLRHASRSMLVLPAGTFRLVGSVREADAPNTPVVGARVEVTSGNVSAVTEGGGMFRLYGVPASADIQVSDAAYTTEVRHVTLSANSTEDFLLQVNGPRLGIGGNFTLAIDVADSCAGQRPLAAGLRHRTYDARVTQSSAAIDVLLTEPRFSVTATGRGNRFSGHARGSGAAFALDWFEADDSFYYPHYETLYPSMVELLPDGTVLVASGDVTTSATSSGQSGSLRGALIQYDSNFPGRTAQIRGSCEGALQFTLTAR